MISNRPHTARSRVSVPLKLLDYRACLAAFRDYFTAGVGKPRFAVPLEVEPPGDSFTARSDDRWGVMSGMRDQAAIINKINRIGPWTPLIKTFSMSAVRLGPVMQVRALPGSFVPWVR